MGEPKASSVPKPDLSQFPEIPEGCCLNYNNRFNLFQVYRPIKRFDPVTGVGKWSRETIGSIKNGKFEFSATYLLRAKNKELTEKLAAVPEASISDAAVPDKAAVSEEETAPPIREKQDAHEAVAQGTTARQVQEKITGVVRQSNIDRRDPSKVEVPMETIVLGSLMIALTGNTECNAISDAICHKLKPYFQAMLPEFAVDTISHDTVRKALMLVDTSAFEMFYAELISPLVKHTKGRIIAADGQALRATGKAVKDRDGLRGAYMLMNFYDATNGVCLYHRLIGQKKNEITVGPEALSKLDIDGAIVTADAMSCQVNFVNKVLGGGAHYCLSLKGNQDKSWSEVRSLFATTPEDRQRIFRTEASVDHGRIEEYTVAVLPGRMLSKVIKEKWQALGEGSIIRVLRNAIQKKTGKQTMEERFFITSLPLEEHTPEYMLEVTRAHWSVENNLHWMLDTRFSQDRIQANNPKYITNRAALNKLALAMLENYRCWLCLKGREKAELSISQIMKRCTDPETAMECLACGLGFI